MPDIDGTVEDSDWELIGDAAAALQDRIAIWADTVRDAVKGLDVVLPAGCVSRCRERWRPLARCAAVAGGDWPAITTRLVEANMAEDRAEREAGLKTLPPGMVIMADLYAVWPAGETFMPTRELVKKLIWHNGDYWGPGSPYGKPLNETRLGRLVTQATKLTSTRPDTHGPRGYVRAALEPVWHKLGIGRIQPGAPGYLGTPGAKRADLSGCAGSAGLSGPDAGLFTAETS